MLDLMNLDERPTYKYLGVHKEEGKRGEVYVFRVYNKDADKAEITGDFNSWGSTLMKNLGNGIFEAKIEGDASIEETCYKYRFYIEDKCISESDRYASYAQCGKNDASIIYFGNYEWGDSEWFENKSSRVSFPMNIYELHPGTWRTRDGRNYNGSENYLNYRDIAAQLVGYVSDMGYTHICLMLITEEKSPFTPISKYGRPDDFKFFVDIMHRAGIGVIIELGDFSDTDIKTCWKEEFHVDGFNENNKITLNVDGQSFYIDTDWCDMVMDYAETEVKYKKYKYLSLNRAVMEESERPRVLSVPHFCVSEGKRSLFEKMQGDYNERFARLRLFYSFMMLSQGKKMTFMGCEYGEKNEWNEKTPLDWFLVECEANFKLKRYVKAVNHMYFGMPTLWKNEFFEWIKPLEPDCDVMSFLRTSSNGEKIIAVFNFSDKEERKAFFEDPTDILLDSDTENFGGMGRCAFKNGELTVPPLSAAVLSKKTPFFEKTIDYSSDV